MQIVKLIDSHLPLQPRSLSYYAYKSLHDHLHHESEAHQNAAKKLWDRLPTIIKIQEKNWIEQIAEEDKIKKLCRCDPLFINYDWSLNQRLPPDMDDVFEMYRDAYFVDDIYPYWLKDIGGFCYDYYVRSELYPNGRYTVPPFGGYNICKWCYDSETLSSDEVESDCESDEMFYVNRFCYQRSYSIEELGELIFENGWCMKCKTAPLFNLYRVEINEFRDDFTDDEMSSHYMSTDDEMSS
ncbi:hypothetical protein [Erinnyis ello granulovirus]|uniref:Uncharacterized protein n=1 Tax=Erinnyis ello granulovirus TaxID=307444 RepID=A0A097DAU9_9BBAC|nr:hypothetical protein [Erinnyis ello granulovirus]AIS92129.1 hypothetical protein [Erinnyis ello granulovirus]ARX71396.1 hypothetical protein EREL_057 [Erinnyis ello granulovirus]ARX71526.1 hypothetical protein EREL_057 [Erinnyis ello granulovirus]ARX71656.1 hypothetical protein EREL_057 [Erinnyis ello granulovirus]ARX71786.1 hypothetical protein EREL_057 [Erinnyis ello granulovirus]